MNKQEFLDKLKKKLSTLSKKEREERLAFYGEMIDDRVEEGLTEAEAVKGIGAVDVVAAQIVDDISTERKKKEKQERKKKEKKENILMLF